MQIISNIGVIIMGSVISIEALKYGNLPIIDLRQIFDEKEYHASSITIVVPGEAEPTNNVVYLLNNHDFNQKCTKMNDLGHALTECSKNVNPFSQTNESGAFKTCNKLSF